MQTFENYAYYYNLFYNEKDYHGEAKIINSLIVRYQKDKTITKVLNLGCGTGKHDVELVALNPEYNITGIDISPVMLKIAKNNLDDSNHNKIVYELADVRTYKACQKYNVALSLFHVMSYQNTNEDILNAFTTAHNALDNNSLFIFDVWYGPGVLTEHPEVRIKKVQDLDNEVIRHAIPTLHPNKNIVDVNYEIYVINKASETTKYFNETHNMRYFFKPEMEHYLNVSGFELVDCIDCNTLNEPTLNSWTVYFVARKKD